MNRLEQALKALLLVALAAYVGGVMAVTVSEAADTYGYSYDPAGRLTGVTKNGSRSSQYAYDANGKRVSGFNGSSGAGRPRRPSTTLSQRVYPAPPG